jgi:hypothetical protein
MAQELSYANTLQTSLRAAWSLDDVLRSDQEFDFSRNFLPESLARTAALDSLTRDEQRTLNQINAHQYLSLFIIIEEFIIPFLFDHSRHEIGGDDHRLRALINFAAEEAKHIHLFHRFHRAFVRGFHIECEVIGPSEAISAEVLRHDPLAVGLVILMIEWMTQAHYIGGVRDDSGIEPLFKSLLKHHWIEEAQHAKLDALIIAEMAAGRSDEDIDRVIDDLFEIADFLDHGLADQVELNLQALERATGHAIADRKTVAALQHQAARAAYIGSGLRHQRFQSTLAAISPRGAERVAEALPAFA